MKTKIIYFSLILFLLSACSSSKKVAPNKPEAKKIESKKIESKISIESHIGKVYDEATTFTNYEYIGGRTLEGRNESFQSKEFACSFFEQKKDVTIVFFEEILRKGQENLSYEILDQLAFRKSANNEQLLMDCTSEKFPQTEIICLCEVRENDWINIEYFEKVKKAWRFNRATKKIEEISTKGIRGINPDYGL